MRVLVFLLTPVLGLVFQTCSAFLLPRGQVCANDGITQAGTLFHRREVPVSPLSPRPRAPPNSPPNPFIWCGYGTTTYLVLNYYNKLQEGSTTSPMILSMLRDAIVLINDHLQQHGDGPIEGGSFRFSDYGVSWLSLNSNNHQQTWGVLAAAVEAFAQYSIMHSTYGSASFAIYNGQNQVGQGTLYAAP